MPVSCRPGYRSSRGVSGGLRAQAPRGSATQSAPGPSAHPGGQAGGPHEKAARRARRRLVRLTLSVRPASPDQNRTQDPVARQPWAPPVRHPPPSGWLDEPGRLKGGGVPSPYSNSLKPTIIVTGIVVTAIRFDLFQLKANRGDRIATRPKVLAREIAIMAPKLAGDGHRPFALEKPNDRCHGMRGRDLDAHMHMIWHHMSLD